MRSQAYLCVLAFASFFLTLSSLPLYCISIGTSAGAAGLVTTVMLISTVGTQTLVPALVNRFGLAAVLAAGWSPSGRRRRCTSSATPSSGCWSCPRCVVSASR